MNQKTTTKYEIPHCIQYSFTSLVRYIRQVLAGHQKFEKKISNAKYYYIVLIIRSLVVYKRLN